MRVSLLFFLVARSSHHHRANRHRFSFLIPLHPPFILHPVFANDVFLVSLSKRHEIFGREYSKGVSGGDYMDVAMEGVNVFFLAFLLLPAQLV